MGPVKTRPAHGSTKKSAAAMIIAFFPYDMGFKRDIATAGRTVRPAERCGRHTGCHSMIKYVYSMRTMENAGQTGREEP